jgi:hypothetical protein
MFYLQKKKRDRVGGCKQKKKNVQDKSIKKQTSLTSYKYEYDKYVVLI